MAEDCIFCKIASGAIPVNFVYEDEFLVVAEGLGHIGVGAFTEKVDHTSSDGSMSPAKPTRAEIMEAQKTIGCELDGLD